MEVTGYDICVFYMYLPLYAEEFVQWIKSVISHCDPVAITLLSFAFALWVGTAWIFLCDKRGRLHPLVSDKAGFDY